MKKYIVLSVNDNVDYLYFTPLTVWSWRRLGWEPIIFYHGQLARMADMWDIASNILPGQMTYVSPIAGYRSDTITQVSRLYAACLDLQEDDYIMTGDIDMLALSDYWKPDLTKVTVYGHDLTGYTHFPICYIGGTVKQWREIMKIDGFDYQYHMQKDLMTLPQAKSDDFYKFWFSDQDLITERIKEYGTGKVDFINRGQYSNGYAVGRVDRGAWTLNHSQLIDAHLMQQTHHKEEKIQKLMDLLHHVWPKEDFLWFLSYTKEFKKMAV